MAKVVMHSPGVQVTVRDFSDYVSQISSSIIGVVGGARRGPTGPTLIETKEQAIQLYGEPTKKDYGLYALLAVLEHCNNVYYDRIVKKPSRATAGDAEKDRLLFTGKVYSGALNGSKVELKPSDWDSDWVNGRNLDPAYPEDFPNSDENIERFGADLSEIASSGADTDKAKYFDVVFTMPDGTSETTEYLTLDTVSDRMFSESEYIDVEVNPDVTNSVNYKATYALAGGAVGCSFAITESGRAITFVSKFYDSTMDGWTIKLSTKSFLNTFEYELFDARGNLVESLMELTLDPEDDRFIESYINIGSAYVNCSYDESSDEDITGQEYVLSGGADGIEGITEDTIVDGLDDFSNPEIIDADILLAPGWSTPNAIAKGIRVCEERQECLFLIDPPFGLSPQQVVNWSNGQGEYNTSYSSAFNSSFAAVYWPWVQTYDEYTRRYVWLPPSAYVASQIAYSDEVAEPWFAPAGLNRGIMESVVNIEVSPSKTERDLLYGKQNCINPIINFKQYGIAIWGQKTTQRKSTALNRVNVRRLVNFMKKVITASSYYFVFDPNDSYLWEKWQGVIDSKLSAMKSRRGIYEYKVIMDSTTVTADDIENNRMPGRVMFKPTKTAEFIPIDFMIMPYSATFEEEYVTTRY